QRQKHRSEKIHFAQIENDHGRLGLLERRHDDLGSLLDQVPPQFLDVVCRNDHDAVVVPFDLKAVAGIFHRNSPVQGGGRKSGVPPVEGGPVSFTALRVTNGPALPADLPTNRPRFQLLPPCFWPGRARWAVRPLGPASAGWPGPPAARDGSARSMP